MRISRRLSLLTIMVAIIVGLSIPAVASGWGFRSLHKTRKTDSAANVPQTAPFTAEAHLIQTVPGNPELFELSGVPFIRNKGQVFEGRVTDTNWGLVRNARMVVNHNSSITIGSEFDGNGTATLVGFAWGNFKLSRDYNERQGFSGKYVASIKGTITLDSSCPIDPILSDMLGYDVGARVEVTDRGRWSLWETTGTQFEGIGASGKVVVKARGCLDHEKAIASISGVQSMTPTTISRLP